MNKKLTLNEKIEAENKRLDQVDIERRAWSQRTGLSRVFTITTSDEKDNRRVFTESGIDMHDAEEKLFSKLNSKFFSPTGRGHMHIQTTEII